jgi:hypothetical protein
MRPNQFSPGSFIGYGQSSCGSARDETKRPDAAVDPHSPVEYRVNGEFPTCRNSNKPSIARRARRWRGKTVAVSGRTIKRRFNVLLL